MDPARPLVAPHARIVATHMHMLVRVPCDGGVTRLGPLGNSDITAPKYGDWYVLFQNASSFKAHRHNMVCGGC